MTQRKMAGYMALLGQEDLYLSNDKPEQPSSEAYNRLALHHLNKTFQLLSGGDVRNALLRCEGRFFKVRFSFLPSLPPSFRALPTSTRF